MSSLRVSKIAALARFEFTSFWSGSAGALALAVFLGLEGALFYNSASSYALANLSALARGGAMNANLLMFTGGLWDLGLLVALVAPLTTMRALAVSADGGHLDLILSWPLRRRELVLGLFSSSCLSLALLALLGLGPYVLLLTMNVGSLKILLVSYLGLCLLIMAFSAVGLAISSLTRTPLASALTTLGLLGLLWAVGWAAPYLPVRIGALIQGLAFGPRLYHFALGLIDLNDVVYFLAMTLGGLALTKPVR
ncbi:MAG: hypothetical protein LBJ64_09885 [Deltaproteobacteria bacterium]|jgi:ABC-2 type transport system permease protein|nr:hypothetical protein [Deltaproteobacteria bacterium]